MTEERQEPTWLTWRIVQAIHFDQVLQHGGSQQVRDVALIESALSRPIDKWGDEGADVLLLAAAYGFGIARNHGFEDGNKRTAFLAMYTFLGLNGYELEAPEVEVAQIMVGVADGTVGEAELATWVRSRAREA